MSRQWSDRYWCSARMLGTAGWMSQSMPPGSRRDIRCGSGSFAENDTASRRHGPTSQSPKLARTADVGILHAIAEGTMKALTQQQVDYYRHNGFLFPILALDPSEVATCLAGLARLESDLGSPVAEADVKWRSHAYAHSPWFNDLVRHPRILDAIEDAIGPNILVWTSTFFIKEPNSPTYAA